MDEKDKPHYAKLLSVLSEVEGWAARIDTGAFRPDPRPGSPLAADDERTDPYQLSHAAWHSLSHAVDHLNCLLTLLRDARVIHMYSPYSLVRGGLENASAAVWMLEPRSRSDRVTRRLRFAAANIRHGEEARRLTGQMGAKSEEQLIEEVRGIARQAHCDAIEAVRRVTYREIVKTAGSVLDPEGTLNLFVWQMCSGIAHGDLWPTINVMERVELPGAPPGVSRFQISANVQALMYAAHVATLMTRRGWELFDRRSRPPF